MLVQSAFMAKRYVAVHQSKQGMVFADTHIHTGVKLGAALAHDDRASRDEFTAESFYTEHFGIGIASISRRAAAFFLCHD